MSHKDTPFKKKIRPVVCGNKTLDFSTPKIMGILNLTPDSFYDGGRYSNEKHWYLQTEKMLREGADIIDIGAVSSRPGSLPVGEKEEIQRIVEPLKKLVNTFPDALFSVDTFRAQVARVCVENGAHIINDISGGNLDREMFTTVADLKVPYILMHMHGTPDNMQQSPVDRDAIGIVSSFFGEKVSGLRAAGVNDIILDPGFGFGKSLAANYTLLKHLDELRMDNLPILAGISRKSMINQVINTKPSEAMNGTTVLNTMALLNGANILRVHDVKEAKEVVALVKFPATFSNF